MTTRRRLLAGTTALLATVAALLAATPSPGWAQDGDLVSSTPADGAALATAPEAVYLTLSRVPDVTRSQLGVVDESQAQLTTGELTLSGPRVVRQQVKPASSGVVIVAYHIVFTDGTETAGSIRFSSGTGIAPPGNHDTARLAAGSGAPEHSHGVDPLGATLLVLDLGVLVGAGLLLILRPKRGRVDRPVHTGPHSG